MKSSRKVIKFKKSLIEILQYVDKKCDERSYDDALAALYFYSSKKNVSYEVWAHIADVYTEIGLYEIAIQCWLKYLILCDNKDDFVDAYNGLGANYYFLGDKNRARYYFDKQINCIGAENCVYNDVLDEYANDISVEPIDNVKFLFHKVYSVDGEERLQSALNKAKECNENGDFNNAVTYASQAMNSKNTKNEAIYQRAYAFFSLDKVQEAAQDIGVLIEEESDDYKAWILAAYIYRNLGDKIKYNSILDKLSNLITEKNEDRARQIAFLYNVGKSKNAKILLQRSLGESPFSGVLLYLKGIFAFNDGDFVAAEKAFSEGYYYTISPILNYYKGFTKSVIDGSEKPKKIDISFEIPEEEISRRTEYFINIFQNKEKLPASHIKEVVNLFDWALNSGNEALQIVVGSVCCRVKIYRKYLISKLVDNGISDNIKRKYVTMLCEVMFCGDVGVTYSGYFKRIFFDTPFFDKPAHNLWLHAYALAFGVVSMMFEGAEYKLSQSAIELQKKLIKLKRIDKIADINALACAFFLNSNFFEKDVDKLAVYALFNTKKENVEEVLNLLN